MLLKTYKNNETGSNTKIKEPLIPIVEHLEDFRKILQPSTDLTKVVSKFITFIGQ